MSMNAATSKISSRLSLKQPKSERPVPTKFNGPFGLYATNTPGNTLNALCRLGVPINVVDRLAIHTDGTLTKDGVTFGMYRYFDGLDDPMFMFIQPSYVDIFHQGMAIDGDVLRPNFKPRLGPHMNPALIVQGKEATVNLYEFLLGMMSANFMTDERYKLCQAAGAFFQGGFDRPRGEWFYIEFSNPEGVMPFIEYINTNFCEINKRNILGE